MVPKSEGGRGGQRNIRPAHKGCNERRGTRKIDSILLDEIRTWYIKQYPAIAKLETERQTLKDKAVTHRRWYKFELLKAVEQGLPVPSMVRRT